LQRLARRKRRMRRLPDQDAELDGGERLREVGPRADAHGFQARRECRFAGHGDDPCRGIRGQCDRQQLGARDATHVPIQQQHVEDAVAQQILRLPCQTGGRDVVTIIRQYAGATFAQRFLVFDDQNPDARAVGVR